MLRTAVLFYPLTPNSKNPKRERRCLGALCFWHEQTRQQQQRGRLIMLYVSSSDRRRKMPRGRDCRQRADEMRCPRSRDVISAQKKPAHECVPSPRPPPCLQRVFLRNNCSRHFARLRPDNSASRQERALPPLPLFSTYPRDKIGPWRSRGGGGGGAIRGSWSVRSSPLLKPMHPNSAPTALLIYLSL